MDIYIELVVKPPAAPHFGGSWERLVQIFKLSLYKLEIKFSLIKIMEFLKCHVFAQVSEILS